MQGVSNNGLSGLETKLVKNFLGDTLEIIKNDYVSDAIEKYGAYAQYELSLYSTLFAQESLRNCLEIGVNIGNHTSLFSRYFTHTHAFEPNPLVWNILKGNVERNSQKATAYNLGISNEFGSLDFYITRSNLGASSFIQDDLKNVTDIIQCKVAVGDDFVDSERIEGIDFIKIDAEGLEGQIVKSLEKTIDRDKPLVCLEWKSETTRKDFERFHIFETIFSEYTPFAISRHFPVEDYSGWVRRTQRAFLKHLVYGNQKRKLRFLPFYQSGAYSMVFFFPKRFEYLTGKLSK